MTTATTLSRRMGCESLCCLVALVGVLLVADSASAQTAVENGAATIDEVRNAALRAVNFTRGDRASLDDARDGFTPEGWRLFMKSLDGFVDDKGTPEFSSEFVPTGKPVLLAQGDGTIHFSIPGTLTQTRNRSSTRYGSVSLDVVAHGTPPKIDRLEQKICATSANGVSCR